MQKRQQGGHGQAQRGKQAGRFGPALAAQHRQQHPCAVIDQRGHQKPAQQRKGVGRARREHKERLGQQIDDQRRVIIEPGLIDRRTYAGKYAICKVGFQPDLQVIVGGIVPQVQALPPHHSVQVKGGAGRDADGQHHGVELRQPGIQCFGRAAVKAPGAQHRRAGEQQQPDIHRVPPAAQHINALQRGHKVRHGAAHKFNGKDTQQKQDGPLCTGHPAVKIMQFCLEC